MAILADDINYNEIDIIGEETDEVSDLTILKLTTARLNLLTRRSSYTEWIKRVENPSRLRRCLSVDTGKDTVACKISEEKKEQIDSVLEWIRQELIEMRHQDQLLARQLITLRTEIHRLKLQKSCKAHKELLEEVTSELEDRDELSDLCDFPVICSGITPLKQFGVTRMNLCARRFSLC